MFINITYLNSDMLDYIDAPVPYIVGVPRDIWKKIKKNRGRDLNWVPNDVSIFDIDKGQFKHKEKTQDLPEKLVKSLRNTLQIILKQSKGLLEVQLYDFWGESTLKVKKSFLAFYLKLLGYFPSFFSPDSSAKNFFQMEEYLKTLPSAYMPFMKDFVKTQHFTCFLEKIFQSKKNQNEILYFLENVELLHTIGEDEFLTHLEILSSRIINKFKHVYAPVIIIY